MNGLVCSGCRAENDAQAKFCDQCGQRLPQSPAAMLPPSPAHGYTPRHLVERVLGSRTAMQGERKRVTVLFADIKGSTRLADQAGAETWHGILDRFFAILSGAVHRHEGTVNQYTGDGIMALFGAPIAHGDHAQRACLAALAMQEDLAAYALSLKQKLGLDLRLRVGLNTGEVIVGRIGDDLRMDYTAKGLTVNLAARMENLCEPGRIYISRYTAALVNDDFRLRDLDEHRVDGLDHPVRVFVLEGLRGGEHGEAVAGDAQSRFVGREAQMAQLVEALAALQRGRGGVIGLRGEAGMGKSRLCREFSSHCAAAGIPLHHVAVPAYAAATPLKAAQTLLRSRLGLRGDDDPGLAADQVVEAFASRQTDRSALIPLVQDFVSVNAVQAHVPAAGLRSLMLERIARFLPRAGAPQVLLIEDLHHAEPLLTDFLTRLCEQMAATPTLLLLSYRTDPRVDWLRPYLDGELDLPALDEALLSQAAAALLGDAPGLDELARRIARLAAGNPFFVEEAVQTLADQGQLQGAPGAYKLVQSVATLPIPDSVHALVSERIDRLPEAQKALLQAAAVMGAHFRPRLLMRFTGSDDATLAALTQAGLIRRQGGTDEDPDYLFCQPLMQEVAYNGQLETRRLQIHAGLATALEALHASDAERFAVTIAHHWQHAEQWQHAGRWNLRAAAWAVDRDSAAALSQYRLAVQHLDRADASFEVLRQRIAARAGLVRMAQLTMVERQEIDTAYHDAWKMAEECADMECAAELMFSYAPESLQRGSAVEAAQLSADAVSQAQLADSAALLRRFRPVVLQTHCAAGRIAEGLALCAVAGDDWTSTPVNADTCFARGSLGSALAWLGQLPQAVQHLRAAADYAEQAGLISARLHADLVDWAWFSGDGVQALSHAHMAMQAASADGSAQLRSLATRAQGLAFNLAGEYAQAVSMLEAARVLEPVPTPGLLTVLAEAYLGVGRLQDALNVSEQALAAASRRVSATEELRAWAVHLRNPLAGPGDAALQRMAALLEATGAESLRPWWLLAAARHADQAAERRQWRQRALAAFQRIGATPYATRFAAENG